MKLKVAFTLTQLDARLLRFGGGARQAHPHLRISDALRDALAVVRLQLLHMSTDAAPSAEDKARYDSLRKELVQALTKKRQLDKQLAATELGIYNLEGNYLAEALRDGGGNIIHGFENYLKNQNTARRKTELSDADRFFSNSSVTYQKSLELMGDGEESTATIDDGKLTAGSNSVVVPIPPAGKSEMSAAQHKKNRDREYQRRKRASNRKSATGQDSDDESVSTMSSKRPTKRARLAEDE